MYVETTREGTKAALVAETSQKDCCSYLKSLASHTATFLNTRETTPIKLILRARAVSLLSLYLGAQH